MSTQIQRRRGTTAQHSTFTGANAELTVDTDKEVVVVHDGTTAGGNPLMREDASNSALALGSAATPSLKWDANTGIYSPGADQVAVATNGVGRLFVDASGNIVINGSASSGGFAFSQFVPVSGSPVNSFRVTNGSDATYDVKLQSGLATIGAGVGSLAFIANDAERMRLDTSGRLGIGNSSPGGQLTVYSAGNQIRVESPTSSNADILFRENDVTKWTAGYVPFISGFRFSNGSSDILTLTNTGNVGIGTTSVSRLLHISAASGDTAARIQTATSGAFLEFQDSATTAGRQPLIGAIGDNLVVYTSAGSYSERARIDSSGRLLVGTSTGVSAADGNAPVQIFKNNQSELFSAHLGFNGASAGARITLSRSRNTAYGSYTILQNNDEIGAINFAGDDGVDYNTLAARISAEVDGTPGANDMPGRLVFSTTSDSASSPTERLRITSTGQVRLAGAGITFNGDTAAANELDDYEEGTWTVSFFDAVTGGNASATTDTGYYTKIGDRVICNFTTSNIDTTGMTGANNLFFTLPFTSSASKGVHFGSCALENINANDASITIAASVNASVARGYLLGSVDNAGFSAIIVSNLTSTAADVWVSITYAA
jgi:hypothetical protein